MSGGPNSEEGAPPTPVEGLLAVEELALGDPGDYGEPLAMGEAEGDGLALTFGVSSVEPSSGWEIADISELVVNEVQGSFDAAGASDAMVMEDEFDPDAEVIAAVWFEEGGAYKVERRIRRSRRRKAELLPYGLIAVGLLGLGSLALAGIVVVALVTWLRPAPAPAPSVRTTPALPVEVRHDREKLERAKAMTADEILEEVLGDQER